MKIQPLIFGLLLAMAPSFAQGQAVPTAESSMSSALGPNLPNLDGVFHYSLSAGEVIQFGYYGNGQTSYSTNLTGNAAYTSRSTVRPFSLLVASGVILGNQGGQGTNGFVNLAVSQGYETRHWTFNISDSFSYLPQSPTTGLSGIPGVGDLGSTPISGPGSGPIGTILTTAGDRIGNSLSGSVERQLNHNNSISGSGTWSELHYLGSDDEGLDTSQVSGIVSLNHRIDARSSASVSGLYSTFSYGSTSTGVNQPGFQTRGINVSYQRVLSRALSFNVSIGPQWISSSDSALIPDSTNVSITAGLSYGYQNWHAGVNYARGANGGSGVLPGAISNTVAGFAGRNFGRDWVLGLTGSYSRSSGLTQSSTGPSLVSTNEIYNTTYGGFQLTRRFSTHFSGYASYTAASQSYNTNLVTPVTQNILGTNYQTIGFGVTFTPRSTSLGQF